MLVIFGAAGGLGSGLLLHFAEQGGEFGSVLGSARGDCDLTQEDQVERFFVNLKNIDGAPGKPYVVVNATGKLFNGTIHRQGANRIDSVVDDTVIGSCLLAKWFRATAPRGSLLVLLSSVVGTSFGVPGAAPYGAAKSAVEGLTRCLSKEFAHKGLRVACIRLGYFSCGMINDVPSALQEELLERIPLGRFGDVVELADAITFLSACHYAHGTILELSGGI